MREKAREKDGLEYKGVYFVHEKQEDGSMLWVYNQKYSINKDFLEYAGFASVASANLPGS